MPPPRKLLSSLLIFSLFVTSLTRPTTAFAKTIDSSPTTSQREDPSNEESGLRFRLSPGVDQPEPRPTTNPVSASELSQNETESILKRLPPMQVDATDAQEFALRERSLPPPRTGQTINVSFPQPTTDSAPETTAPGPLEVLRYAPEGDVPLAPQLSVTFSQPMITMSSQEEAANVPVKLAPQPPGKWRWVGTKTLLFEPAGRFPMATQYTVNVPAGTRSANGGQLAAGKTWSFATPPPTLKMNLPMNETTESRDTLIFMAFDQRIDPAAVLRTIKVRGGNKEIKTRLATSDEIAADEILRALINSKEGERSLVFRAVNPVTGGTENALPPATLITVSVSPGIPSAEGPRLTTKAQQFSFRTYGALRVVKHDCESQRCDPFDSFNIEFSNPLKAATVDESKVKVEPAIDGLKTSVYAGILVIKGLMRGRTNYQVTLDGSIEDQFGQRLGLDNTVSFYVGPASPSLFAPGDGFVVLNPEGPPRFSVYTVNQYQLKVRLYSVEPTDWPAWLDWIHHDESKGPKTPPGRLTYNKTVAVRNLADEIVETQIDLASALRNGVGQMIVIVEPHAKPRRHRWHRGLVRSWVQRTNIGLDAFVDRTDLVGWATSLKDGSPLKDVAMTVEPYGFKASSGGDGLARISLEPEISPKENVLVARVGNDVAILPEHDGRSDRGSWFKRESENLLRWYVFDDRKLYRPGEEVSIKGWIRHFYGGKHGDLGAPGSAVTGSDVQYTLKDSRGNEVTKAGTRLNALGGFDLRLKLPPAMNLGSATLQLATNSNLSGARFSHRFDVQEFRRPEFEVIAKTGSDGPYVVGSAAEVYVNANYYAGGGLPNAAVSWRVTSTPSHFTPPNRSDFTFGKWVPWWIERSDLSKSHTQTFNATTDAGGKHRLQIDFDSVNPPRASNVTAQASVVDVNRQSWTSTATMLVHPADLYVGLKSETTFVQQGEPLVVRSIVTDLDGNLIVGREIKMVAVLLDWRQEKGEWKQVETDSQECVIRSLASGVKCAFQPKQGGQYRVTSTIRDDRGRRNESELTLWVAGGTQPPKSAVEKEDVELIPNQKEYQPGETAEVLVQAPFYPAEGLLTIRRSGILKSQWFHMDGPTITLRVLIEPAWIPNVYLQVDLVGAADGNSAISGATASGASSPPKRPGFASGDLNLSIPPYDRKLAVAATPRDKAIEPSGETSVGVEVKDARGTPVSGSEVAVVVVDESVLALTDYKLDDPISVFYPQRSAEVSDYHSRANVLLNNRDKTSDEREQFITMYWRAREAGEGGGMGPGRGGLLGVRGLYRSVSEMPPLRRGMITIVTRPSPSGTPPPEGETPIRLRENFNALAAFAPSVRTDANGRAQVQVKLPDNLTRYRVMAVAVAGDKQFGSGESSITARMPLMVRPSAPRFLNFGDQFELPIVVQNQTDDPMTVDLAVRANSALLSVPASVTTGRRLTVPANDRVELRIPATATTAGTARFQVGVVSGARRADAAEISLPVWTPATTEAFATYGEIDQGAITQPFKPPAEVFKQFGGLELETSSTQLQQLTDAFLYLQNYPYECSEQLASRILSVAALRDVLTAFKAKELPPPQEIEAAVMRDIKRLQGLQADNGGFGFWKRGDESWPYLSIHVAHALARAKQKKFDVPADMLEKSRNYLRNIEVHIPSRYGVDARRALISYALYARAQMGDRDTARARRFAGLHLKNLSLESLGWLLSVLSGDPASQTQVAAIRRLLGNRVTETAATAHFVSSYQDDDYLLLNSNRRADGVILEALIGDQPTNDLIPKIVRGLLDHRTQGRWANTQENIFILLALDKYFNTYEKVTPDFVARVWLGDAYAGE
ncbi:MAG: Ig-like domain-containing protein, partial [Pyrinomonadaceae bacterium]|nr:Ig-like domain-containing protein [Pyrinomonadaceae bacterium]